MAPSMEDANMRRTVAGCWALAMVAIASSPTIAMASVGPCAREIIEFQRALPRDQNGDPTFVASAPQSIAAQLERQPTQASVERAKKQAQTQLFAALAQAQAFDAEGKRGECKGAIAWAKLLLNP
jgi:hypothetical protein